jgi:hypothetical protein
LISLAARVLALGAGGEVSRDPFRWGHRYR